MLAFVGVYFRYDLSYALFTLSFSTNSQHHLDGMPKKVETSVYEQLKSGSAEAVSGFVESLKNAGRNKDEGGRRYETLKLDIRKSTSSHSVTAESLVEVGAAEEVVEREELKKYSSDKDEEVDEDEDEDELDVEDDRGIVPSGGGTIHNLIYWPRKQKDG